MSILSGKKIAIPKHQKYITKSINSKKLLVHAYAYFSPPHVTNLNPK